MFTVSLSIFGNSLQTNIIGNKLDDLALQYTWGISSLPQSYLGAGSAYKIQGDRICQMSAC